MNKVLKTVGVIGHFGFGKNLLNGQTIKTKTISNTLKKELGENEVLEIDTRGGIFAFLKLLFTSFYTLKKCKNVIILPAHRGVKIVSPILLFANHFYRRKLHYVVIGGWLPLLCVNRPRLSRVLKKYDFIYVETTSMKLSLEKQGFNNIIVLPNFKNIIPLKENELVFHNSKYLSLCTFSRVMEEKGISDAIDAVVLLNEKYKFDKYNLDIYGPIEPSQQEWFAKLASSFPTYITYKGEVDYNKSVDIIKNYYALLFPTYYTGEGFAGTVLDAMAAGVPVVASDWKYNNEIINKSNGVLFATRNVEDLAEKIDKLNISKIDCLKEFIKYSPEHVIKTLLINLEQ